MLFHGFIRYGWMLALVLASCAPGPRVPQQPQALPSPAGDWTLKLTQSGGFAGMLLTVEVSSDGRLTAMNERGRRTVTQILQADTLAHIEELYVRTLVVTPQAARSVCADCFLYSLEFESGGRTVRIEADDTTLDDSGAAELIRYLQQLRDTAFKSLP